jgi:hypothetical protein
MINVVNGICMDCGHRHRGVAECSFCECVWETVQEKISMIKKIKNFLRRLIFWTR